ncbi:hypothetical protein [Hymenobacter sp. AT01-02]|nr:hypothetical protein [Hymenobacter sp. AT01-02]
MDSHLEYIAEVEALFGQLERVPAAIQRRLDDQEALISQLEKTLLGTLLQGPAPTDAPAD